jgi:hypothetical protein
MALGDNLGSKLNKPATKRTQPRERRPIKASRIKYIVISVILFIAALFLLIFMLWAKGGADIGTNEKLADHLYSASRYFCRVKYPDNWDVTTGDNGFYMDKDTGLIFQLYPFTTEEVKIELAEGATQPPVTPEPMKIQTEDVLVSVYYHAAPDFAWPATPELKEGETPVPTEEETPAPTPTPAPYSLDEAAEKAVEFMKGKILPEQHELSEASSYSGKNCDYKVYTYRYTNRGGELIQGEMSVCSRSMSYYMVNYEARSDLFEAYYNDYKGMVDNFILSVFDY